MMKLEHRSARRVLIALLLFFSAAPVVAEPSADPVSRVKGFYGILLETMKEARRVGVEGRYKKLTPAIQSAFDLPAMTRIAVGPTWITITPEQQGALVSAFSRMTVATYASRFDGYDGERFEVDPKPAERGADRIVNTRIVPGGGEPVALNYLVRASGGDWKIVDVYLSGTISELAVRRSEFASILKSGGTDALVKILRDRGDKLLAGG